MSLNKLIIRWNTHSSLRGSIDLISVTMSTGGADGLCWKVFAWDGLTGQVLCLLMTACVYVFQD